MADTPSFTQATWAVVDLDALAWNVRVLQRQVGSECRLMPVVKADAYGHGAVAVARCLQKEGVDWLCVARSQEGIELRQAGLEPSILVLGPLAREALEICASHNLIPTLFDTAGLEELENLGKKRRQKLEFHLKIDTGMGRLGLQLDSLSEWLGQLARCKHVRLTGLYSHLASIESIRGDDARRQVERFHEATAQVEAARQAPKLKHMAASSAILDLPEAWLQGVRSGLVLYGVYPSHRASRLGLRSVMAVHTRVAVVREIPAGNPLGYEGTFVTQRHSRIAVLPIGYGDGLPQAYSNRGCVSLGGHRVPIVGQVSMDLTLVDVTDVPAVQRGDEVIIFGEEGRGRALEEFAHDAGISPYEILCRVGVRVPRVYRQSGNVIASRQQAASGAATTATPAAVPPARS